MKTLKILIVGKDARTVAMAWRCAESRHEVELYGVSESRIPALVELCKKLFVISSLMDTAEIARIALEVGADLVVIGPEEPLGAGLVDALHQAGIDACFGPPSELAQIETSKSWARQLLDEFSIDGNPRYRIFDSGEGIEETLEEFGDFVVKPDGLTGGKGVKVSGDHLHSVAEGRDYALSILASGAERLVIEEKIDGEEFSLQTITDGSSFVHCPVVQDAKRAEVGDQGPNTGGMGSYSMPDFSLPFLNAADISKAKTINESVIRALRTKTGHPYKGVLYGGFIATADGIRLIEYNARFADPESMNVLAILETDFVDLCLAVVNGTLRDLKVSFSPKATVCKYVVPIKYPYADDARDEIIVPRTQPAGTYAYWASTNLEGGKTYMKGSRAIAFVGVGDSIVDAETRAEQAAQSVRGGPVKHREDIGTLELIGRRTDHMRRVRPYALHGPPAK